MNARRKRRYWPYLILPMAAAVPIALLAVLAARERAAVLARLADHVANNEPQEAAMLLRQMAAMRYPPMDALVMAARCPDLAVSAAAKESIDEALLSCQDALESPGRTNHVADQLGELADALARQQSSFMSADQKWIAKTTHELVRIANRLSPDVAPNLAARCDAILAAVELVDLTQTAFVPPSEPSKVGDAHAVSRPPDTKPFASIAPPAVSLRNDLRRSPVEDSAENPIRRNGSPETRWRPEMSEWPQPSQPPDAASQQTAQPEMGVSKSLPQSVIPQAKLPASQPAELGTRQLLEAWLRGNDAHRSALEQELAGRGFRRLAKQWVSQYFSDRTQDRLQLIDVILREPDVDARPWLMLLADDKNADVRLSAVTIMATSNDLPLLEKALEVAIRDRDPRIADLAARLHQRLSVSSNPANRSRPR
jgi:hypothetical protein